MARRSRAIGVNRNTKILELLEVHIKGGDDAKAQYWPGDYGCHFGRRFSSMGACRVEEIKRQSAEPYGDCNTFQTVESYGDCNTFQTRDFDSQEIERDAGPHDGKWTAHSGDLAGREKKSW